MPGGHSPALLQLLQRWLSRAGSKASSFAHNLYEDEDCHYLVRCSKGAPDLHLSFAAKGHRLGYSQESAARTAAAVYQATAQVVSEPEEGFDLTLQVSLEALQALPAEAQQECLLQLARLRLVLLGQPLRALLQALAAGALQPSAAQAVGHPSRPLLLNPQQDSVAVLLPIFLTDTQDAMLLQAFAQEFAQARRAGLPSTQNAPECSYSQPLTPPFPLSPDQQQAVQGAVCGVAFVFHRQHVRSEALLEQSVLQLLSFHASLENHVKSYKAHTHSKMRTRMKAMMHTLAMARAEQ